MLPALVPFQPEAVKRILIDTRIRRLDQAMRKALTMDSKGAMFSWEVGYSGVETTNWEPTTYREIHITGDIAQFAHQYMHWTNDTDFLWSQGGYNLFYQVARFWESKFVWLQHVNAFGIENVMGPDENNDHVNNSVYTNALASICLRIPKEFYALDLEKNGAIDAAAPDPNWIRIADQTYLAFDEKLEYHPEYDGYEKPTVIKQADVVLLGYPLMVNMTDTVRQNDLQTYELTTSPDGPCMTWSMHSINWLDLSNEQKAYEDFEKNYRNIHGPFKVWTENGQGREGAINFITGIGGFLQNLLYGYLGLRIKSDRLDFDPKLLPTTSRYDAIGIKYMGNRLNFSVNSQHVRLEVDSDNAVDDKCLLYTYSTAKLAPLQKNTTLVLGKYAIICKCAAGSVKECYSATGSTVQYCTAQSVFSAMLLYVLHLSCSACSLHVVCLCKVGARILRPSPPHSDFAAGTRRRGRMVTFTRFSTSFKR